jgi:hypothetical protein
LGIFPELRGLCSDSAPAAVGVARRRTRAGARGSGAATASALSVQPMDVQCAATRAVCVLGDARRCDAVMSTVYTATGLIKFEMVCGGHTFSTTMAELALAAKAAVGAITAAATGGDISGIDIPAGVEAGGASTNLSLIEIEMKLGEGEKVLFHYHNNAKNKIVLTNRRFVKIEDGRLVSVCANDAIKSARHIKNGALKWDKVEVTEKGGRVETFGIYKASAAEFFTKIVNKVVGN